jgi:hypothetical protein
MWILSATALIAALALSSGATVTARAQSQTAAAQRTGKGDSPVGKFTNSTGSFQICLNATGVSPSGSYGPDATVFIEMVDGTGPNQNSYDSDDIDIPGNPGCQLDTLEPGDYTVKVLATPWTSWSVAVYPGY